MMKGRSIAELQLTIDTSLMAVRQEVLEKIRFINVENQSFENLYSMLLAKSDISTAFYDEMKAYSKKQTTMHGLFKKYFNFVKLNFKSFVHGMLYIFKASNSVKFKEYVFSLVYPSDVVLIFAFDFHSELCGKRRLRAQIHRSLYVLSCYITTMLYLFLAAKVNYKEVLLYPAKLIGTILLPVGAKFKFELPKDVKAFEQIKEFKDINLERIKEIFSQLSQVYQKSRFASVEPEDAYDVYLTDGKMCKLQILEQDGLVRAVLWFNKKRLSSSEHIRTSAAIAELSEKLLSKGFALKICQNCGYFEEKKDGRHNSVEGKCYFGMVKNDLKEADVVQLWEQCNNIIPAHVREYIKKQLESKE
jgi:hypothetical protein